MAFVHSGYYGLSLDNCSLFNNHILLFALLPLDDEDLVHVGEEVLSEGIDWPNGC